MDLHQRVLVVPFPAQGHVMPLIKLAYNLAYNGINVTFANSEFAEAKILAAMSDADKKQCPIRLVTYSDGMESQPDDQRYGQGLMDSITKVMPGNIEKLIKQINCSDNREPITCVIADLTVYGTLEVASRMGLKQVAVWPAGPASLALSLHIPQLIKIGVIDGNGSPTKNEVIRLSDEVPVLNSSELLWINPTTQKAFFNFSLTIKQAAEKVSVVLCNTFDELDSSSCAMIPNILPIGPLPLVKKLNPSIGTFSSQDSTCLKWLDKQPSNSVIYIAFGSTAVFSQKQFNELALGLELSGHSFLWVVRSNIVNGSSLEYPDGFLERTANRGKIVEWAPQEKVLAHTSISCFTSHCGWNSTMEGLSYGVPFLCWPYFWDQFHNKSYICDMWKVGLSLKADEDGIISRHEIKTKIDGLLNDDGIRTSALKLMEDAKKSVNEGGSSYENFKSLIKYLKA
ncbi:putative UDP-glucuronosyltransferase [Heracleum sosnowskyi]|uniref:UDP-glucuronosyltransferase n=1 Tax=Heracleum sosnowskyi TaxID=360622 RepID=A0AAD8M7G3_9APIA|nr:putative UDP-glucuronosyltransferase [Heracleum sosnowskyi]